MYFGASDQTAKKSSVALLIKKKKLVASVEKILADDLTAYDKKRARLGERLVRSARARARELTHLAERVRARVLTKIVRVVVTCK